MLEKPVFLQGLFPLASGGLVRPRLFEPGTKLQVLLAAPASVYDSVLLDIGRVEIEA